MSIWCWYVLSPAKTTLLSLFSGKSVCVTFERTSRRTHLQSWRQNVPHYSTWDGSRLVQIIFENFCHVKTFRRICQKMRNNFPKKRKSWRRRMMRLLQKWENVTLRTRSRRKFPPCQRSDSWTTGLLCPLTGNSEKCIFHKESILLCIVPYHV